MDDMNKILWNTLLKHSGHDVVYCPQCNERINEETGRAANSLGHFRTR